MGMSQIEEASELIGRFSGEMTLMVNGAFGGDWAENEEILALVQIVTGDGSSSRHISEVSGLSRRAVSRLVARLRADLLVETARSPVDRRLILVSPTARGRRAAARLRGELARLFSAWKEPADEIAAALGASGAHEFMAGDPLELLRRIAAAGAILVDHIAGPAGRARLTGRERAALLQIAARPGIRPTALSPSLGVTRGGVSYLIDQLAARDLVRRLPGTLPEDRRAVGLETTEEGTRMARLVTTAISEHHLLLGQLFVEIAAWSAATAPQSIRHAG